MNNAVVKIMFNIFPPTTTTDTTQKKNPGGFITPCIFFDMVVGHIFWTRRLTSTRFAFFDR
jgi:hypothetical protein